ncbi:KH domain-containing protein [Brachyspira hyodysenteriae]|uniref:KH domain-containing protein n=1 Tax=Brachyspira hyodysenteriae TaxID=159 RepID=UPI001ADDE246|nr:KH domain-containing protein [Brachyspira hyodysenteriae]MBT8719542.1 KH domain-containing protein [Brachyspira hyodysenteriae]MBT8729781.1 KH domain-containing protein [Brachyspira hyodysenteriae]MBT8734696.1 KH domain-containing protein [Brachyspira hyodysenteriae]MBT8737690.1 KH domain-containing protein [Brachyspira hyodysenteriae]MBT8740272.1 KH domain-containing protein [Brachyspira hyodysenteriae]
MTEEKELIEYLAKKLVDEPEGVSVKVIEGEKSTILELKVNQSDIGKRGRIAHALRTILFAASMKSGKRVMLEIIDN